MTATRVQGWYYLLGGGWPLAHFRSFEAVAGPKPDRFQTQVASVLFATIGAALLAGTRENGAATAAATRTLAVGSAAGVAALEWRYRQALRPIFLAEAALEAAFAAMALRRR